LLYATFMFFSILYFISLFAQLELLRDRLREKDEALDKKSKQLAGLQIDKKRLETELSDVSDKTSTSDRQIGILNRKVCLAGCSVLFSVLFCLLIALCFTVFTGYWSWLFVFLYAVFLLFL